MLQSTLAVADSDLNIVLIIVGVLAIIALLLFILGRR